MTCVDDFDINDKNKYKKDKHLIKFSSKNIKKFPIFFIDFSWIKHLNCPSNNIEVIDVLPPNLETLSCEFNLISQICCILPNSLKEIRANNNQIKELYIKNSNVKKIELRRNGLFHLECPKHLETLDISFNDKPTIIWPDNSLKKLYANNCGYNDFNFPDSLIEMFIPGNKISSIDTFPTNLKKLNVCSNLLTNVSNWPDTLVSLVISGNKFKNISGLRRIKKLRCSSNRLLSINIESPYLQRLVCYDNDFLNEINISSKNVVIKSNRLIDGNILIKPIEYVPSILQNSIRGISDEELIDITNNMIRRYVIPGSDNNYQLGINI